MSEETARRMEVLLKSVSAPVAGGAQEKANAKPQKLTEHNDIVAYFTTFERMMQAFSIEEGLWTYRWLLSRQTGRAQQAYAAMPSTEAADYQ